MKTGYVLKDLMNEGLVSVQSDENIMDAARAMNTEDVGCVLVDRGGHYVGLLTQKDIIGVLGSSECPRKSKVSDYMSFPIRSMDVEADIYDAMVYLNEEGIRHLPVAHNGLIVGIVTMTDLIKVEPGVLETVYHKAHVHSARAN